jgi:hypothetical protein
MQPVENVTERGTIVVIDGKLFNGCRYEGCTLIFAGGDFGWQNTIFANCPMQLEGAAARTLQFLKYFNIVPQQQQAPDPMQQPPSSTKEH